MYIHQTENWPNFTWDKSRISLKLAKVNKAAGFLEGRLSAIGFDVRQQAAVGLSVVPASCAPPVLRTRPGRPLLFLTLLYYNYLYERNKRFCKLD